MLVVAASEALMTRRQEGSRINMVAADYHAGSDADVDAEGEDVDEDEECVQL